MRLLSDRCTQNAAPSASFHAQYHPRLGHPLIQQTPQDPCTALGRIRAVLSRSRKHRGFSRASGDVCCHTWLNHWPRIIPVASRHQRWYTLASCRSLSTSARSYSSPRHKWALSRGIVRGRVVWRHDLAGRSSLGRRALGSSTPRPTPYSSHAAGSPDSTAPAVSRTHLAAAPRLRTSAVDPGPSSKSCCRRRRRRRQLPPSSLVILTT